jgi:hypothetical protein
LFSFDNKLKKNTMNGPEFEKLLDDIRNDRITHVDVQPNTLVVCWSWFEELCAALQEDNCSVTSVSFSKNCLSFQRVNNAGCRIGLMLSSNKWIRSIDLRDSGMSSSELWWLLAILHKNTTCLTVLFPPWSLQLTDVFKTLLVRNRLLHDAAVNSTVHLLAIREKRWSSLDSLPKGVVRMIAQILLSK